MSRYDNNGHFRPRSADEIHRLESIHPGHENIDDQELEFSGFEQLQTGSTIVDGLDGMRIALKQDPDGAQDRLIIVNDENASHGVLFGCLNPRLHIS